MLSHLIVAKRHYSNMEDNAMNESIKAIIFDGGTQGQNLYNILCIITNF